MGPGVEYFGFGLWGFGFGFWILGLRIFGFWILDFGFWVLELRIWGLGSGHEPVHKVPENGTRQRRDLPRGVSTLTKSNMKCVSI